ncbi:MAG: TetR/AcrR family transcriptional regulator [Saprospiraceae bacterium]
MEVQAYDRIKIAAAKVFTLKGMQGARMQDIADEANINKAMLHYYFKNKQQLFEIIFEEKLQKIFGAMETLISDKGSFDQRLKGFIERQITIIMEFPVMPLFVMLEVRKNPELLVQKFKDIPLEFVREKFKSEVASEVAAGNIREVSIEELLINVMSLCVYPIIAQPLLKFVLDMDEQTFQSTIERRKTTIFNMIMNDLKIK